MTDAETILRATRSILVVDWPTKDLPETVARAGYAVHIKSGPGPDDYVEYTVQDDGSVMRVRVARLERVDLVHVYRPIEELPGFVALALELGATTVWFLSGLAPDGTRDPAGCWLPPDRSADARRIVESAGLAYIERPSIVEAVREMAIGVLAVDRTEGHRARCPAAHARAVPRPGCAVRGGMRPEVVLLPMTGWLASSQGMES